MFGIHFDGSSASEQILFADARRNHCARKRWRAARERSCFVENDHIQIACPLEGEPVFDKQTVLRASEVEMAITSGMARPRACGQAMMSTVAARIKPCPLSPASHQ